MTDINEYLHTWNPPSTIDFSKVKLECDTLREGMQGAFAIKPSMEMRKEYLTRIHRMGVETAMVAFPASSPAAFEESREMLKHLDSLKTNMTIKFLARATERDLLPIADLNDEFDQYIEGDFFIGCSAIRRKVEGWDLKGLLEKIDASTAVMAKRSAPCAISLEDSSRAPAEDMTEILTAAVRGGVRAISLCDTVGETLPGGVRRFIEFARETLDRLNYDGEILWHGHNDRGLALYNALAAAEAGATIISGTFLGLGERTGNTPLELFILNEWLQGCEKYDVTEIIPLCRLLAEEAGISISPTRPVLGEQAFATSTGTHTAAVVKARQIGIDFEDYVFSGVPASKLGLEQDIRIGPLSGRYNAIFVLRKLGLAEDDANIERLLKAAKEHDRILSDDEVNALFANEPAPS